MGILDFLSNTPQAAPSPAPQPNTPPPQMDQATFFKNLIAAAAAHEKAQPTSLFSWLTGTGRDAATAAATAAAPGAWQQYQDAQQKLQAGGLNTAQSYGAASGMTGVPIDPNNPMASVPALSAAYGGILNPTSAATGGPGGDPLAAQRAFYLRMSRAMQMMGNNQGAQDYLKMATQGIPAGAALLANGTSVDGGNGQPIAMSGQDFEAQGAGKKSTAENAPRVAGEIKVAGVKAGLDQETHRVNADVDAQRDLVNGIDTTSGKPVTRTRADLLNSGAQNFAANNPYFAGQQDELKDLRGKSESADQGLGLAQQISNAAQGIYTGKGAGTLQDARKWAQAAGQLTGAAVGDNILNDTSKFEQLKFASQQLVAVASHALSPRVAMNIYNQIAAVKPGDATSIKGLRDIINNQIVPALLRDKALYSGVSSYYKANPLSNDAMTVVPGRNPLQTFHVKQYPEKVNPGDYFISRHDGTLKQAPGR